MTKKSIIYVPGLNDTHWLNKKLTKLLIPLWKNHGYQISIIYPHWNKAKQFSSIQETIVTKIDSLYKNGHTIYLIGQSAGGSTVLNAFTKRQMKVTKVVNVCGRLRKGNHVFPSLSLAAHGVTSFKESVLLFENMNEKRLSQKSRKKILLIKPFFDEIVPSSTNSLKGAKNITIPMVSHSLGGISALTIYAKVIRHFFED